MLVRVRRRHILVGQDHLVVGFPRFDQAQLLARSCLDGLDTILDFIDIGMEPIIALSESEILLRQFVEGVPQVDQVDDIALPKPQGVLQSGDKPDQTEDYRPKVGQRRLSNRAEHLQLCKRLSAGIDCPVIQRLLDPEQPVVLGCSL